MQAFNEVFNVVEFMSIVVLEMSHEITKWLTLEIPTLSDPQTNKDGTVSSHEELYRGLISCWSFWSCVLAAPESTYVLTLDIQLHHIAHFYANQVKFPVNLLCRTMQGEYFKHNW